jgi:hypothetical protein
MDNTPEISPDYVAFLEEMLYVDNNTYDYEEIVGITIKNNSLARLLVRPDATPKCTEFNQIFYDDVTIQGNPEFFEISKKTLIDWYLNGCGELDFDNTYAEIYIDGHVLESTEFKQSYKAKYCCDRCPSRYYINVYSMTPRILYDLYKNLKKLNRLSEGNNLIHFIAIDY